MPLDTVFFTKGEKNEKKQRKQQFHATSSHLHHLHDGRELLQNSNTSQSLQNRQLLHPIQRLKRKDTNQKREYSRQNFPKEMQKHYKRYQ